MASLLAMQPAAEATRLEEPFSRNLPARSPITMSGSPASPYASECL